MAATNSRTVSPTRSPIFEAWKSERRKSQEIAEGFRGLLDSVSPPAPSSPSWPSVARLLRSPSPVFSTPLGGLSPFALSSTAPSSDASVGSLDAAANAAIEEEGEELVSFKCDTASSHDSFWDQASLLEDPAAEEEALREQDNAEAAAAAHSLVEQALTVALSAAALRDAAETHAHQLFSKLAQEAAVAGKAHMLHGQVAHEAATVGKAHMVHGQAAQEAAAVGQAHMLHGQAAHEAAAVGQAQMLHGQVAQQAATAAQERPLTREAQNAADVGAAQLASVLVRLAVEAAVLRAEQDVAAAEPAALAVHGAAEAAVQPQHAAVPSLCSLAEAAVSTANQEAADKEAAAAATSMVEAAIAAALLACEPPAVAAVPAAVEEEVQAGQPEVGAKPAASHQPRPDAVTSLDSCCHKGACCQGTNTKVMQSAARAAPAKRQGSGLLSTLFPCFAPRIQE